MFHYNITECAILYQQVCLKELVKHLFGLYNYAKTKTKIMAMQHQS